TSKSWRFLPATRSDSRLGAFLNRGLGRARLPPSRVPTRLGRSLALPEIGFGSGLSELGMPPDLGLGLRLGGRPRDAQVLLALPFARPVSPDHGDPPGPGQFEDPVGADLLDERLDLLLRARDPDHQLVGAAMHDPAA